ncbi:MAG: hypothetical protein ACP5SD_00255, partial [Elusimicrobiales bacterium]
QKIGSRYKKVYDMPKTPLSRLYAHDKNNANLDNYVKLKQEINPFDLINDINNRLDEIWSNRSKKAIREKNYLREQERLKEIENLLKKEVIYG